jgi:excinuclease UvrABC nuclease subunit
MSGPITLPANLSGVYHLMSAGEVIYVGQSLNVWKRIAAWTTATAHRRQWLNGLTFDAVLIKPTPPEQLDEVERADIEAHQPRFNREGVFKPYRVPQRGMRPDLKHRFDLADPAA